jgi:hypothetical protein
VTVEWTAANAGASRVYKSGRRGCDKLDRGVGGGFGWWAENRWVQWFCGGFPREVWGYEFCGCLLCPGHLLALVGFGSWSCLHLHAWPVSTGEGTVGPWELGGAQ